MPVVGAVVAGAVVAAGTPAAGAVVVAADAAELGAATESVVAGASGFVSVFEAVLELVLSTKSEV